MRAARRYWRDRPGDTSCMDHDLALVRTDAAVSVITMTIATGLALELVIDEEGPLTASWQGVGWWRDTEIGEA